MKKAAKIIGILAGIIVIIVIIAVLVGGNSSIPQDNGTLPQDSEALPQDNNQDSQEVIFDPIIITGSSDKTSPPFEVTTKEWIIEWSYIPDSEYPEYAVFGFFVYPRGETVMYVEAISTSDDTSGSTYSYAGIGEYYVEVICGNLQSWEIIIRPAI